MENIIQDSLGVLEFDGTSSDVVEFGHDAAYEISEGTIAFSFVATDTNGAQGLFSKDASGYAGGGNHFVLFLDGSTLKARFQDGTDEVYLTFNGIVPGEEYEIAVTFGPDGSALWVDGALVASDPLVMDWTQNVEVMQWGGRGWASASGRAGFDAPFQGTISDPQIYSGVLTADQIAALADSSSAGNAAPVPGDDSVFTAEDSVLAIAVADLLANDTDPDGDTPVFVGLGSEPEHGSVAYDPGTGTLIYTPDADFHGDDSFQVIIGDGVGGIAESTVNITVTPENDAPSATDDTGLNVVVGQTIVIDVLANDADPDGDELSVLSVSDGLLGTVVDNGDGTVSYTAALDSGQDSFTYTIDDGNGGTATATVTLDVLSEPNTAPDAGDDTYVLDEDTQLIVLTAGGLLANDYDPNSDPLSLGLTSSPTHGALALNADGSFSYTPDADFHGTDSFTYTISDGLGGSDTATVTLTVTPVNDAPVALDDTATAAEGEVIAIDVLANDTDVDGDVLSVAVDTGPAHGTATANADGTITYTPQAGYTGTDSFTYTLSDGNGGADTASVTIDVGGTPPGLTSDDFHGELESAWTFFGIAGDATLQTDGTESWLQISSPAGVSVDAYNAMTTPRLLQSVENGDFQIRVRFLNEPNQIYQEHGLLILESDTRWFRFDIAYTPAGLELLVGDVNGGTRSFPYRETISPGDALYLQITRSGDTFHFEYSADNLTWNTATTLVSDLIPTQIGPFAGSTGLGNNPPPGFVSMFDWFESDLDPIIGEDLDGTAPDANDDYLQTTENAALTIVTSLDLLGNDVDVDGDTLSVESYVQPGHGTLAAGAVAGELVYTPDAGFTGVDSFTYSAGDGTFQDVATVYIGVAAPGNTAPVAIGDTVDVIEDTPTIMDPTANDTDADGDGVSVLAVGDALHGTVTLNQDGTITYTPDPEYAGPDSFSYTVTDGQGGLATAEVVLNVIAVDDAPVVSDTQLGIDDDAVVGSVVGSVQAYDPEGQPLAYQIIAGDPSGIFAVNADGQVIVADADALAAGGPSEYTLQVEVSDGNSSTVADVAITVADGDLHDVALVLGALQFRGNVADAVILPHDPILALDEGSMTFAFEANTVAGRTWLLSKDASGFDTGGHIGVYIENGLVKARLQSTTTTYTLSGTTLISAGDFHHVSVTFGAGGFHLYLDGQLEGSLDYTGGLGANEEPLVLGANQWTSVPGYANVLLEPFNGVIHTFELYREQLTGPDVATLAGTVDAPPPEAPIALADIIEIPKGIVSYIDISDLLANDIAPGGGTLSFQSFSEPSAGTLVDNLDGRIIFTPPADFEGLVTFEYSIANGTVETTGTVILDIGIAPVDTSGATADWRPVSTTTGGLERPGTAEYTALHVFDANGDGLDDYIIAGRNSGPAITLYLQEADGSFLSRVIETAEFDIEAGGTIYDVDGDGDLDIFLGGDSRSTEMWWWENPGIYDAGVTWDSHTIKTGGANQHHDMAFGDFDNDGVDELAFWNQKGTGRGIYLAEIPADPTQLWSPVQIYDGAISEGMAVGDVDGDGIDDIVVGGYWLKWVAGTDYLATTIDPSFPFPQTAVGDLNGDGQLDVLISSGDADGPLLLYTYTGDPTVSANWTATDLLGTSVDEGHSLEIADFDQDGNLDIFIAEMNLQGLNPDAETWVLFGDGAGNFEVTLIATGVDNHEATIGDLDGDGDLDIIGKGFYENEVTIWYNTLNEPVLYAWDRNVIDASRPYRAIFEEAADIDGDGLLDIVTGGWWYRNPGEISGNWQRNTIGAPMNNMAAVFDFDGDGDLDIIGTQGIGSTANSSFAWAENDGTGSFDVHTNIADGAGAFLQGTTVTRFSDGGPLQVVLSWQNGVGGTQILTVPDDPVNDTWQWSVLSDFSAGEGLDAADIDGDGDNDILTGFDWLRNDDGVFTRIVLHNPPLLAEPDRVHLVDMDNDGDLDALVGFGHESSITTLAWYEQGNDPEAIWTEHVISDNLGGNPQSVDVFDLDGDGDQDVVAGEHLPNDPGDLGLFVFENLNGNATEWGQHLVFEGDEHHDGAQLADLDNDGDMDIYSIGWTHSDVVIYENLTHGLGPF